MGLFSNNTEYQNRNLGRNNPFTHPPLVPHTLRWRHNDHAGVSNHQPHGCLLNRSFRHKSKKTSKLRVTGLCARNSPGTGEFPAQMASYAENVYIWWRHHDMRQQIGSTLVQIVGYRLFGAHQWRISCNCNGKSAIVKCQFGVKWLKILLYIHITYEINILTYCRFTCKHFAIHMTIWIIKGLPWCLMPNKRLECQYYTSF